MNPNAPKWVPGSFYSLADLRKLYGTPGVQAWVDGKPTVPPTVRAWVDHLKSHPDLATVQEWRHAVLHRMVMRHPMLDFTDGVPIRSAPSAVTALDSLGLVDHRVGKAVATEVVRVVGFGEAQLESLCQAFLAVSPLPMWRVPASVIPDVTVRRGKASRRRPT